MKEYITVLKKYVVFSGRSTRKEFWMFALVNFIIFFILNLVSGVFIQMNLSTVSFIVTLLIILYWLAVLIPYIAVTIRRLHDTNRTGWWLAPALTLSVLFIPLMFVAIGAAVGAAFQAAGVVSGGASSFGLASILLILTSIVGLLSAIFNIILLVFMCLDSTPGENRFGPNPKGVDGGVVPNTNPVIQSEQQPPQQVAPQESDQNTDQNQIS